MECSVHRLNELKHYKFVVILSEYKGKLLFSRHKERTTWETQGGHIESGESPIEAARRELYEESGAVAFSIVPLFDYRVGTTESSANGIVFFARIKRLAALPESEIQEIKQFDELPANLTYPEITPVLFEHANKFVCLKGSVLWE